jgi:uncharacterized membrane protein
MKINKYLIWFLALFLFVVMVTVMPTGAAENTSNMKNVILQMTTTLENSDTQLHFNYAENIGDGRGITFGCIGFCTGTYDGNILIKHYTELNPDNVLAKYIPALDKIDAGSHYAADGDGNPSVEGLSGFIQDVNSCDDPLFKKSQMDKLDELYYNPAMEIADSIGAKNALTKAFIYDMCIRHGVDGAKSIIKNAGTTPKQGADENTYLQKLLSLRDVKLKQEGAGDVNRNQGYKNVLNSGNIDLKTPFTFVAYGDYFTIDGKLDLGEQQQETTVEDRKNSTAAVIIEADNRLREASPDIVYQSSSFIDVGGIKSFRYRDVMRFDLSEYTSDSHVSNATLSLYWYYPAGTSRPNDTVIEVYRPASSWNSDYVSWNKRDKGVLWKNPGGNWYDKNGVLQGSTPYATITIKGSTLPENRYYELDVTDLVKDYTSGKYENTGFLIKARTENNNYIAFYSSEAGNENQKPRLAVTEQASVDPIIDVTPVTDVTVTGAMDNRLREASSDTVFKSSTFIDVGGIKSFRYRDVMRFDLSEYEASGEVSDATLSLYWYYPAGSSRLQDTVIEVYRPASAWNSDYVSWNKKDKGVSWINPGGDWYDKNGVSQGSTPYATITIKGNSLPDNRYYELDVTDLVKEYTSGKYENTGFLIKARTESNNYIAFSSSDVGNINQVPKLQLAYS